jgi:ribosomal-protein-alanine N-acetyltransferase
MNPELVLKFDGGILRALQPADVHDGYVAGLNDPEVNRFLELKYSKQTLESVTQFVSNDQQSLDSVLWGIWQGAHPNHVGTVRIHGVEYRHRTAHIGVCLFDKNAWGRGLGKKAIATATRWAIDELGMRWVEAGVYAGNHSSMNAFLSAGYSWVYDIPEKYLLDDQPATVKIFALRP